MRKNKPSASGLYRLALCPGSWQAEQAVEPPPPSADAALGTELHRHMELGTDPADPAHAEALLWCRTQEQLLIDSLLLPTAEQPITTIREERLWAPLNAFSGQKDVGHYTADTALLIDYKFGRLPVEPAGSNIQLMAQAYLEFFNRDHLTTIHACILAPFVSRATPQVVTYTEDDIPAMGDTLQAYLTAAAQPNAPLRPSLHACRYCRAASTCPAASQHALTCQQVTSWTLLPVTDRAELYRRAQLAKKLVADVEAHCREDLLAGVEIPGLTLKPGKTTRKLSHTEELAALCATHNIAPSDFCAPSLPQLEKAYYTRLKATNPKYTAKQAKEDLSSLLASSITSSTTAPTIAEI